ncbi:MAG: DUF4352 domain-containing protein [Clostridiales bacterium]|nr:DUF4352 domain-containing protein [Clostridiales bacterium]
MKRTLALALALACVALAGCTQDSDDPPDEERTTAAPLTAEVGETTELGAYAFTVHGVEYLGSITDDDGWELIPSDEDGLFLQVNLTVQGQGGGTKVLFPQYETENLDVFPTLLVDAEAFQTVVVDGHSENLHDLELSGDETAEGFLLFEIPKSVKDGDEPLTLRLAVQGETLSIYLRQ